MLHYAIPALEALFRAWSNQAVHPKYHPFASALHAACGKIDEYYVKMMDSPAYILSMSKCSCPLSCILDVTDMGTSSSQSKGEDGLFQEALAS